MMNNDLRHAILDLGIVLLTASLVYLCGSHLKGHGVGWFLVGLYVLVEACLYLAVDRKRKTKPYRGLMRLLRR